MIKLIKLTRSLVRKHFKYLIRAHYSLELFVCLWMNSNKFITVNRTQISSMSPKPKSNFGYMLVKAITKKIELRFRFEIRYVKVNSQAKYCFLK